MDKAKGHYAFVPISVSQRETHRFCSKRLKIGGKYLVDDLTAAITNVFMARLAEKRSSAVKEGEALFRQVLKRAKRSSFGASVLPKCLPEYGKIHGALVLFPKPYPILERRPAAAFRGLLRIDGDRLIDALCDCWSKGKEPGTPHVDYWCQGGHREAEAVAYTTARGVTKATARGVLIVRDLLRELKPGESVHFPGVGRLGAKKGTFSFMK